MKTLVLSVWVGVLTSGCNYDTGECYPRDEQGAGSGGVITPGGPGGFGDVPPEPQTAGESADPCSGLPAECTVTWKAGSDRCEAQGTALTCTTLYRGLHASLDQAKEKCERTYGVGNSDAESCGSCRWANSSEQSDCDEKYQDCINNGPTSCLKKEGGKTLCNRCLERCNAGDSPSAKCKKCKF